MFEEGSTKPAPRRRGAPGVTGAILLITIGVIVLLNNLDILSVNLLSLVRFWPVILILIGLDIILGRRSALGSLVVALIAVAVLGGIIWMVGVTGQWALKPGETVTHEIVQDLGDVKALELDLSVGVMETRLEALTDTDYAVQGTHKTNMSDLALDVNYKTRGDTGVLTISQNGRQQNIGFPTGAINELDLGLTSKVPVDVIVDAGVGESTLDLTGIDLASLKVNAGVGSVTIILPEQGDFEVEIDAGVGSVELTVPKSMEARIEYDGGLSSLTVPGRFTEKENDVWVTDHYSGATDRTLIKVKAGVGEVTIRD